MKERTIEGKQGELVTFDTVGGNALPLLFLHADSGRSSQWAEVQQRIGTERRAVAFDFRGHGTSAPAANGDYRYSGRADDVARVPDELSLATFIVVAHSGAGAVALHYAADHVDRVAGLLLVDPPTDPRALPVAAREGFVRDLAGPGSLQVQKNFYAAIAGPNPAVRERVLADCEAVDAAARAGVGAALATWNPEPALRAWRGPLFMLASTANDNPHALYALKPDVPHEVVPGTGHWIQLDQPHTVVQAIHRFAVDVGRQGR